MYKLNRYWNRLAYLIINIGYWMIWDQTGKNADILGKQDFARQYTKDIMCNTFFNTKYAL